MWHRTAEQAEGDGQFVTVSQDLRLNHRVLDLRTAFSQAVFRLQSAVCQVQHTVWRPAVCVQQTRQDVCCMEAHRVGGVQNSGLEVGCSASFTQSSSGHPMACSATS